jgi:magnesium transporter
VGVPDYPHNNGDDSHFNASLFPAKEVVLTINLSQKRIAVGNRSHGTQSSTIIVRGLATGEVDLKATWKVLWQEFATGALLGGIYGLLLGAFAKFRFPSVEVGGIQLVWQFPIVVGISICVNMTIAATVGTIIPICFKRIRVDPAIATGPFVTTSIDVLGILSYFIVARVLLFQ